MRGRFIVIDGVDGAGKTTQAALLKEALETEGRSVLATRQPGGCLVAERIRALLLDAKKEEEPLPLTEVLLHSAARHEHAMRIIAPALAQGTDVVCDRYVDSTYAYQGAGGGADMHAVALVSQAATGGLWPDTTFILDLPVEAAFARIHARGATEKDARYEREGYAFFTRVAACFRARAEASPDTHALIDATLSPTEMHRRIRERLRRPE
jgi:dTMP kinase